ncbi:MAG: hypothetical protein VX464_20900 [Pseudomonadota bacterium]|nr:hypothetical protein [Pseudomonadota bacterium]
MDDIDDDPAMDALAGAFRAGRDDLRARIEALEAEKARLIGALTPSEETKAAYMGEFSIPFPTRDEDGNELILRPNVPWTTIKEIMSAIRQNAAPTKEAAE